MRTFRRAEAKRGPIIILAVVIGLLGIWWGYRYFSTPGRSAAIPVDPNLPLWVFVSQDNKVRKEVSSNQLKLFTETEDGMCKDPESGKVGMAYRKGSDMIPIGG